MAHRRYLKTVSVSLHMKKRAFYRIVEGTKQYQEIANLQIVETHPLNYELNTEPLSCPHKPQTLRPPLCPLD